MGIELQVDVEIGEMKSCHCGCGHVLFSQDP